MKRVHSQIWPTIKGEIFALKQEITDCVTVPWYNSAIGSELAGRAMGEGDLDDHLGIKPLSLVAKFDAFSDDTENDE